MTAADCWEFLSILTSALLLVGLIVMTLEYFFGIEFYDDDDDAMG